MTSALRHIHETLTTTLSPNNNAYTSTLAVLSALPLLVYRRTWREKVQRKSLDTLPADIQLEIFKHLEWWDILHARQVCRSLYHISKSRHLWLDLFNRYHGQDMPYTLFLAKKLECHSASDLEDAILGPHKADVAWMRHPPRIRKVPARSGDKPHSLLPGGRWALATTENVVVCYDLADPSPEPTPVTLVANPMQLSPGDQSFLVDIATDVDTSIPSLTLNLAVSFCRYNQDIDSRASVTIQVWRLASRFDSVGQVVGLEPQLLSTFDDNYGDGGIAEKLYICGQYVAYGQGLYLRVVDWTKLNNRSNPFHERQMKLPTLPRILFSNGRILEVDLWTGPAVHDASACSFPPGVYAIPTTVLWQKEIPAIIQEEQPLGPLPNSDHTADQFLLLSNTALSILSIPRGFDRPDNSNKPTITAICGFPEHRPTINGTGRLRYASVCRGQQPQTSLLVFRRVRLPHPGVRGSPNALVTNNSTLDMEDADVWGPAFIDDTSCSVLMAASPDIWYIFESILPSDLL